MAVRLRSILQSFLDILYPPTCVGCGVDSTWLCDACAERSRFFRHAFCGKCGGSLKEKHVCIGDWPFAAVLSSGSYADPLLRSILTRFKYQTARCLTSALEKILRRFRDEFQDPWPWAGQSRLIITALPTDKRHIRQRGYDHATILADLVQKHIVPWGTRKVILRRKKGTFAHATLPANLIRQLNIEGAFESLKSLTDPVLLIDDVFTTGASASEAARVLLAAGAPAVYLLAIARGK